MKVTIVVGGRWHAFDLARELHEEGVLHRLVTNYPRFKTREWGIPDDKVASLPLALLCNHAVNRFGGERLAMRAQHRITSMFGRAAARCLEGSSVIHGWSGFSEPAMQWAKGRGIPFVLERGSAHILVQSRLLKEEHDVLGLPFAETHPGVVQQELREYSLADRVAVPSLFVKRSFLDQGFPESRLVHNPFGADLRMFSPGPKGDEVFRVVYAGAMSVQKGIHHLLAAFKEADIEGSELVLVGSATEQSAALFKNGDRRTRHVGHVPQSQLVHQYRNSSVFVMPSVQDGLALVQAQAMACGLPLICTTNTGGEDLLRLTAATPIDHPGGIIEFPAGFVVPARDSGAIATCLTMLAHDPGLLRAKREAALSIRTASLSWKSYARRAIAAYATL